MTNFDVWKESITIDDDIIEFFLGNVYCEDCPAHDGCKFIEFCEKDPECTMEPADYGIYCSECFRDWANKEVEEEAE